MAGCGGPNSAHLPSAQRPEAPDTVYIGNPHVGIALVASGIGGESFTYEGGRLKKPGSPTNFDIQSSGDLLKPKNFSAQRLDFLTGEYVACWSDRAGAKIEIRTVADPENRMIAQRISSDRGIGILERGAGDWHVATRRIDPTTYDRFAWLDGATATTYADVFAMSKRRLRRPTDMDIVIDGPQEDQEAIRSFLYYLKISGNPILPPMGLSSERYGGFRFWDAEAWMLPVYCFTNPEVAKLATAWRRENSGDHFAWEAGPAGQDETPPEFTGAVHVAGWAVWWSRRAEAFGLATAADTKGLARIALKQFQEHAVATDRGIEIRSVESPDEGRLRNNDLVTNLLAKMVAEICGEKEWSARVVIPTAADGVPQTFDNDHMRTYQQAAALLSLFPLEWTFDARTQKAMFERYKDKATKNGPAMSDAVHAVIAARLGMPEEAYRLWRRAWQPFLDDRMQFRERRSSQEGYFVTGAAGCIESVLYGFAGIKVVRGPGAIPLKNGYSLSIRPRLPPAWKSLTIKNLQTPSGAFRIAIRGGELSVSRAK